MKNIRFIKDFIRKPLPFKFYFATYILIAINALVYVISIRIPELNIKSYFSLNAYNVVKGHAFWQFVTYMFVHGNTMHLISNMLGLFFFGISLERSLGSNEFVLFYFVTGILSGFFSFIVYLISNQYNIFLMGASGAVYAVLLLFAVAFPRAKIYVWGILPIPAPVLVLCYAGIEIYSEFFASGTRGISNVAHLTHLFGFGFAWLYSLIRLGENPWKVWKRNFRH